MTNINWIIRPAAAADEATIKRMVKDEQLDPTTLKWGNFLIAEQDGQMIGIGQIKQYRDCQELGSLVVLPEYRNRGVAAALIAALEAKAARPLYLICVQKMQSYYARFGYRVIGWRETPGTLRLKRGFSLLFWFFGIRVLVMQKG